MNTRIDRRAQPVAIISEDPLLAALLGGAVELAGWRPCFPRAGETDAEAVRRLRPSAILIDAEHPGVHDDTLLGRSMMGGAILVVFGRAVQLADMAAVVARYRLQTLSLPEQLDRLPAILGTAHSITRPSVQQ